MIGVLLFIVEFYSSTLREPEVVAIRMNTPAECHAKGEELKAAAEKDAKVRVASYKCLGVPTGGDRV